MNIYPRGSEWSMWDLHIHTPKSIIQNYGGDKESIWDTFIKKIASLPAEVTVIAITDYLFCDGYEYLLSRKNEIPNIKLIIPNIEFRLNTFSGTDKNNKRHNFHVLFDPLVNTQDIREQFLNCLSTGYKLQDGVEWNHTPTIRSLEELGKEIKRAAPSNNTVHSKSNLEVGFDNITYKREDIEKLLEKTTFKGRFVTAIGYSEWDQSKWDQSAAEKRTLINSANFSLTSVDDPEKILKNKKDLLENKLNSLVLHSSDAHDINRVGCTMLWIKADPTFAGLKQVLNEPDVRVFIGKMPPNYKHEHKIITQISIPSSNGWFPDNFTLKLNRDLVTIIGGRGSGKSALAEAIAYGAGSQDNNEDAFLKKASKHKNSILGTKILIYWANKEEYEPRESIVGDLKEDLELVRYLPQGVVEELCSHNNSDKLQKQIENVIFQALDETRRMGASDFSELKNQVLIGFQSEKKQIIKKIRDINKKICDLEVEIKSLPEKKKNFDEKNNERDLLTKSLPILPEEDKKRQEELASLIEIKKKFETKITEFQGKLNKIFQIETKLKIFQNQIKEFNEEISLLLKDVGITNFSLFRFIINEVESYSLLNQTKDEIAGYLKILEEGVKKDVVSLLNISESDLQFDNLHSLNKAINDKQNETQSFETTKLKYQKQKKIIFGIELSIKALKSEIYKIEHEFVEEKIQLEKDRVVLYCSYFEILLREKIRMEELYKPLQESLSCGMDIDKRLIFEAKINYCIDSHYKNGLNIIDRTRKGNFREINSLKIALNNFWDECVRNNFDKLTLECQIDKILKNFTSNENSIEEQLRENCQVEDFYNWLFNLTDFEIIPSLKFDDTDLILLSPGQKGIILLMLYLEIDKEDYRPLIIDQPEENLDNLSIYKDLINYFRERKQYRQIIMVTHNPNLVVNTDSEQIIIANYNGKRTPRLEYVSGSLEDQAKHLSNVSGEEFEDGIIDQVCNILEGGEHAFEKRKKKYKISPKSKI